MIRLSATTQAEQSHLAALHLLAPERQHAGSDLSTCRAAIKGVLVRTLQRPLSLFNGVPALSGRFSHGRKFGLPTDSVLPGLSRMIRSFDSSRQIDQLLRLSLIFDIVVGEQCPEVRN
jgi:hypothetical protein